MADDKNKTDVVVDKKVVKKTAVKKTAVKKTAVKKTAVKKNTKTSGSVAAKTVKTKSEVITTDKTVTATVKKANKTKGKVVNVTLVKSLHGRLPKHRATLTGLGLKRINHTVTLEDTKEVRGMINKVSYLITVTR